MPAIEYKWYNIEDDKHTIKKYKEYKRIIYQPGRVARIILNRPRYYNAVSHPLFGELDDALDRAAADPKCRVIVLSGAGPHFCSGDDAIGLTPESAPVMADGKSPEELMKMYGSEKEVWRLYNNQHQYYLSNVHEIKWRNIPKATIAMVHGYAVYMGWVLAHTMDICFATEDSLWLYPGAGPGHTMGTWIMNPRKALEINFEHRFVLGREMYEVGNVNRVFPDYETLERETLAYADRVAENVPTMIRVMKKAIYSARDAQGFMGWHWDQPSYHEYVYYQKDVPEEDRHAQRYEGRGMARSPRAFTNTKITLESQGKEVPKVVLDAIARAKARDDKAVWQKALKQEWREKARKERAEAEARAQAEKEGKKK